MYCVLVETVMHQEIESSLLSQWVIFYHLYAALKSPQNVCTLNVYVFFNIQAKLFKKKKHSVFDHAKNRIEVHAEVS